MKRWMVAILFAGTGVLYAESLANRTAQVDADGVLRWSDNKAEVVMMGVNYYTPFTVDYTAVKSLGIEHRQVIRDDVAHLHRLGLNCIRVHCFDREFSDADGNLVENQHTELLDFLVATCASNGIYTVITPIAWWRSQNSIGGFSERYSEIQKLTTEREAWVFQARFLQQFAERKNQFTSKRYADDPAILAFECINEPLYPKGTPDAEITEYINTLVDALRASGTTKPIYYNSWHGGNAAAGASRADGVTCVYYPTGLVSGQELEGAQLGRVKASSLNPDAAIAGKSKMAYEFDAADVGASYMYPAIAKLFRAEGVQVATQFQYDPMVLADVNRNWKTHHLNLIYTPGKALSMAVAAEVFACIPMGTPYKVEESEMHFPPFRVSASEALSEMAARDAFIYSNATTTKPPEPGALRRVWGCKSSPVVQYSGSGAYFLDYVMEGVWRLQLYPDVFTVADPYSGTHEPKVKLLPAQKRSMRINLPKLKASFELEPGNYVIIKNKIRGYSLICDTSGSGINAVSYKNKMLELPPGPRYVAPELPQKSAPLIRGKVAPQWRSDMPLAISAEAALAKEVRACLVAESGRVVELSMKAAQTASELYRYEVTLAGNTLAPGAWQVTFSASGEGGSVQLPALHLRVMERDGVWSLFDHKAWARAPTWDKPLKRREFVNEQGHPAVYFGAEQGFTAEHQSIGVRVGCDGKGFAKLWQSDGRGAELVINARAVKPETTRVELALVEDNGVAWGINIPLTSEWQTQRIPLSELKLFTQWDKNMQEKAGAYPMINRLAAVNLCFGAWLYPQHAEESHGFEIAGIGISSGAVRCAE